MVAAAFGPVSALPAGRAAILAHVESLRTSYRRQREGRPWTHVGFPDVCPHKFLIVEGGRAP